MRCSWVKGLVYSLALLLPGQAASAQPAAPILVVKSSDNSYFEQTIETLRRRVGAAASVEVVAASALDAAAATLARSRIAIALGQAAAETLQAARPEAHRINAYLTREQFLELDPGRQTAVLLDQPLPRYLAFCRIVLGIGSVGVIVDRDEAADWGQDDLLRELDLELNLYRLDQSNKLLPVLRRLLRQNDSLLMLPRQSIYNRDSLKGVLLTSYRDRKPVISYSPAHVKSGALASIYSSPEDIGNHLALLVGQKLRDPAQRPPAFEYARFYSISSNRRVAYALSIALPDENAIRAELDRLQ